MIHRKGRKNHTVYLPDEAGLLGRIANGDTAAFAMVFAHYRKQLYTTIYHLTGSRELAEDVLQEVFMKVWLHRERLPVITHFGGWIYRVTEHAGFKVIRELRRTVSDPQSQAETDKKDPLDLYIEKELDTLLDEAVARLPDKQQQTYKLIKQEGLKRNEVADQLLVSPETVKWNLDQAMRSIRRFCLAKLSH
ncbi:MULTISPECIES: RNA polymerase sigma factor [Chitinophaga]|uniref:RNA polymerase sigma factor n=1 Tax=Chitinophaga TaxID=79328 RepID=UPI000DB9BA85|nr:sigma-70 family RNA polymerase sigma factor [Chitinophaga ginsengisegetis]MDR6570610.1 RNA polymerase sigma-70 factor (ECF subfamily) [Chitinophaga ginsengisegetis]MDR6650344.1 RNA polymerase sigma-70 factor (ECF subfamily) [Chitinophaga ginsengisegetis]MDR6656537.1 RNA polymerase sigma-70 factor (ECF subfamily) [Chitinophaga ginsengisegetis]